MKPLSRSVLVREHAWLFTEEVTPSLDCAQISVSAFDYLCKLSERFTRSGARLAQVEGRKRLKLDNYVGVLETPCGTAIEIVPKHHAENGSAPEARALLRKMLLALLDVPTREVGPASLQLFDAPLSEWVMHQFLQALDALVTRGLRMDYVRVEEVLPFLRGQLDLNAQLRQPPGKRHQFNVRHDVYGLDRPENRLLKLALELVRQATQSPENWRLAQELSARLHEVPVSRSVALDFRAWGTDRLLAHYRAVRPWCELILNQHMPLAVSGDFQGLSLLFPMEKLFERYVARWLRNVLAPGMDMRTPARSQSLCTHDSAPIFQLEPDILISQGRKRWVLDTKWKLLNATDQASKYGLSQSDFYQLYAYGQKYLGGSGRMALIYPRTSQFEQPLKPFHFDERLSLWVLPFDLDAPMDSGALVGGSFLGVPYIAPHTPTEATGTNKKILE